MQEIKKKLGELTEKQECNQIELNRMSAKTAETGSRAGQYIAHSRVICADFTVDIKVSIVNIPMILKRLLFDH